MLDDFLVRALLAGVGVALMAGPLGCFVVWRRMAYFGDSLAHNALLGVALGLLLGIDPTIGVAAGSIALALLLVLLQRQQLLASDTLLGILSHSGLALGLVVLSFLSTVRVDLFAYLFGDLLAVRPLDIAYIYIVALLVLAGLALFWRQLLLVTLNEELAAAEGIKVSGLRLGLVLMTAITIAVAMKVVGVLLITSLLIIPAAAARRLARTPEEMALGAALLAVLAVAGGLAASYYADTPSGPSVVVTAALLFVLALGLGGLRRPAP
ncbi:zinc ABC transporter permease subunit ZnuB [Limibacillus halophilus]|jgi:zinc transport system permease protein